MRTQPRGHEVVCVVDGARSPKQQLENCERFAATNGYEIAAVHDSGRSESGKTMARASVDTALERIHSGQIDGVIVAWLDRFGRAPIEEAMTVLRDISNAGGPFIPADLNGGSPIDPQDPQAETNLVIQLQIARQQWLTTANSFDRNRKDAIAAGKHIGRVANAHHPLVSPSVWRRAQTPRPQNPARELSALRAGALLGV